MSASSQFTAPPPPGIACDCEVACDCPDLDRCPHEPDHWHQRFMGADCDCCSTAFIEADVFAYTRSAAFDAIANHAQERGWLVSGDRYVCPECRDK